MEFKDIVKNRYSCRQYQDKKVPEETIRELLEIIVYSASAINLQPWRIKVVSDRETKDKLFPVAFNQEHVRSCSHLSRPVRRHGLLCHHRQVRQDPGRRRRPG